MEEEHKGTKNVILEDWCSLLGFAFLTHEIALP